MNTLPPPDRPVSSVGGRSWKDCPLRDSGDCLYYHLPSSCALTSAPKTLDEDCAVCDVAEAHFSALDRAVEEEREECAKIAETWKKYDYLNGASCETTCLGISAMLRARNKGETR